MQNKNNKLNIGVIGCGHWGPNHIRTFNFMPGVRVAAIADIDNSRLDHILKQYPDIKGHNNYNEILENPDVDAVVIATPTQTHYEIAKKALESGKHVLCEKPLCKKAKDGKELGLLAKAKDLVLLTGHIFLFNHGIIKLKELLKFGDLGKIYYISANRTNLGPIRNDVNAVYDLASHDISIFNFLLDTVPLEVSAIGMPFLQKGIEDVAFITLRYPNDILANIHVSWLNPKKVRHITVVGDKKMATWDDLAEMGPIVVYDKGVTREHYYDNYGEFQLLAREGDLTIPKVKVEEPLKVQANHFISCIKKGAISSSNSDNGVDVVFVMEAISESISLRGQPVKIG